MIAAQLAKIGIVAKLENVEWAQWLSGPFKTGDFDLTIVLHVEPFDLGNYTNPEYYWGYNNPKFNDLYKKINNAPRADERNKLLGEAQQMLANDAVNGFLFQPQLPTVGDKRLKGVWKDMPTFVNDVSAISWS